EDDFVRRDGNDRRGPLFAVPQEHDLVRLGDFARRDLELERRRIVHLRATEANHHVTFLEAGFLGRTVAHDSADDNAFRRFVDAKLACQGWRERIKSDPDARVMNLAVLY